jgi:multidrug efflux system membrane fusion protein
MLVSLSALPACSGGEASNAGQPAGGGRGNQQAVVPVAVGSVVQKSMPIEIKVIGSGEAYSTVAVHAQVTGQLTSVTFKEGDDVKQGQVLFSLDRRPLEAALQQAQANLERDLAQSANAASQAKRYQDLEQRGIATREQVDTTRSGASALSATVEADRAAIENAKVQLEYATIAAPLTGRTGALMVHEGNLVRALDTTPLVVINQVAPIYVSFGIPEARLPDLKRYMAQGSLRVSASPPNETGPAASGRITFVDNAVDATTGTIRIKGTFPNTDRRLWPGQFVNVVVALTTDPHAIVAPSAAIQASQQGPYAFVVNTDRTVESRTVVVDRVNGDETVVRSGLKPGETVVTDGHLRLVPGSRVSIKGGDDAPKVTP